MKTALLAIVASALLFAGISYAHDDQPEHLYKLKLPDEVIPNYALVYQEVPFAVPQNKSPVLQFSMVANKAGFHNVILIFDWSIDGKYWTELQRVTNQLAGTVMVTHLVTLNTNTYGARYYQLYGINSKSTNTVRFVGDVPYVLK